MNFNITKPASAATALAVVALLTGCATNLSCPAPPVTPVAISVVPAAPAPVIAIAPPPEVMEMTSFITFQSPKRGAYEIDRGSLVAIQEIARSIRLGRLTPTSIRLIGYADMAPLPKVSEVAATRRLNAVQVMLERMEIDSTLLRREDLRDFKPAEVCPGRKGASYYECLRMERRVQIVVEGTRPATAAPATAVQD